MSGQKTRQWLLANPPTTDVVLSGSTPTFTLQETTLPSVGANQVLLKVLHLSNDPAQRGWIDASVDPSRLYTDPVKRGDVMRAYGVCEVVESKADTLKKGQLVMATSGWSEYSIVDANTCRPIQADDNAGIKITHFIGALGGPGLTAFYGLIDIGRAKAGETIVVSGAGGATGSMVVQIAKHIVGAKQVIGIAGGEEKCRWVESLGADVCVNYKASDFKDQLIRATDGLVDVYFDNVGGEILDFMLTRMKRFGRISACGAISVYNSLGDPRGVKNWFEVISNRLEIRGFIVTDAVEAGKTGAMLQQLAASIKEGKIKIGEESETIVPTKFEDVPKTFLKLFEGGNQGKLVTQLI